MRDRVAYNDVVHRGASAEASYEAKWGCGIVEDPALILPTLCERQARDHWYDARLHNWRGVY